MIALMKRAKGATLEELGAATGWQKHTIRGLVSTGRVDIGPAARRRRRDLVIQTEAFVRDPPGTMPRYPLWDKNRGFGP